MARVLVVGGSGRIGSSIARDVLTYTDADVTITGRNARAGEAVAAQLGSRVQFLPLDLAHLPLVKAAIAPADCVVHAAGPFHHRDVGLLQACIEQQISYLDVSDERGFTTRALALNEAAAAAGVTALVNTGIFPGISNSLVRKGIEALEQAEAVQLSYVVAGSGGAGVTVMRTTFLGLQRPFEAWLEGRWQLVKPYTERQRLTFPSPYGDAYVYWYDMPETLTLQQSFPVQSVITKFGVVPDFYNHATWAMAHGLPGAVLRNPATVEFLARVSYQMTTISDRFSGTGVAVRCDVRGTRQSQPVRYHSSIIYDDAAMATGIGTGSLVALLLSGELRSPGVQPVERAVPTPLFEQAMQRRHLLIQESIEPMPAA